MHVVVLFSFHYLASSVEAIDDTNSSGRSSFLFSIHQLASYLEDIDEKTDAIIIFIFSIILSSDDTKWI